MSDILRKMGLFGIGVMAITQEKLEEFTQEMVKKGEMNREEGKKFVIEVLSEKDRQFKEIEDKISDIIRYAIKDAIEKSGVATKADVEYLKKRIDVIENKIDQE